MDIVLGGDPGSRSAIRIRGTSTLNASSDPLIVIDGVPYPTEISDDFNFSTATEEDLGALLNISPNDIASVEVLKDASATAIWGTQGANGVLVIKTKQGTVGKTRFSFSSKWTMKEDPSTIPMLNGKEYTSLMQESIWNSAKYIGLNNPEINTSICCLMLLQSVTIRTGDIMMSIIKILIGWIMYAKKHWFLITVFQ